MQHRYVIVTNRHICYESHREYRELDIWREYYEALHISTDIDREKCASLLVQISKLCKLDSIEFIVLREKDLGIADYKALADMAVDICRGNCRPIMIHYYYELYDAQAGIQLPVDRMRLYARLEQNAMTGSDSEATQRIVSKTHPRSLGVSIHSVAEALEAQALGATYLVAGNIYETDCKKGLAGKGLKYLREICESVTIPVYAIGGINGSNIDEVMLAGAEGGCIMSAAMRL